jgi:hypothetical protein
MARLDPFELHGLHAAGAEVGNVGSAVHGAKALHGWLGQRRREFRHGGIPFVGQNGMHRFALQKKAALPNVGS